MDEKKVMVVVIGTEEEEATLLTTKTKNNMIEGREKLRLMVVCMSAWCVWTFCWYLYFMMLIVWDTNLARAILSAIPFLSAFLVHLCCMYLYLSNKISSFVVNPQTTTRKQIVGIIARNYFPFVTIYILVHCFVLYHILDVVTPGNELKSVVTIAVMCIFCSIRVVYFGGYLTIKEELESYQLKQQSAATTSIHDQQHMTELGGMEKENLIEMVKNTSLCSVVHVLGYLIPLIVLMWLRGMADKKPQVLRSAVLYLIPILFILLITLIWLHRYAMDCINKSFDEINPQSTTTRGRILVGNARKQFAFTAINFGVHLFILYIISDEVTRKNELLQLLVFEGFLLSMSYLHILMTFAYIPVKHK